MVLGSHNSWSYVRAKKWWMRLLAFTAKCQNTDIKEQYEKHNVRCFDLRVRFRNGKVTIAHGLIEYDYTLEDLHSDFVYLNHKGDVFVRVLHEERDESGEAYKEQFLEFCSRLEKKYENIKFWCGRNLYNWNVDYEFGHEPSCDEKYASVCKPRIIDDWIPWIYAKFNNKKIKSKGTDKDILLIDFVDL